MTLRYECHNPLQDDIRGVEAHRIKHQSQGKDVLKPHNHAKFGNKYRHDFPLKRVKFLSRRALVLVHQVHLNLPWFA